MIDAHEDDQVRKYAEEAYAKQLSASAGGSSNSAGSQKTHHSGADDKSIHSGDSGEQKVS